MSVSTGGYMEVINNGTVNGNVLLQNGNGSGCFTINGHYGGGDAVTMGSGLVSNAGTIEIGQAEETSTLTISGDYRGLGRLVFDADFAVGEADRLMVTGDAAIRDRVEIRPMVMHRGTVEIARVGGELTLGEDGGAAPTSFFRYNLAQAGSLLTVTPEAAFTGSAEGLGYNRQAVAGPLQSIWDKGIVFDTGFTALAAVDAGEAVTTLEMLSGQALGLIGASRYQASQQFVEGIWSGCDVRGDRSLWLGDVDRQPRHHR
jgi:hypothetical protein